jgi:hypothetical protein
MRKRCVRRALMLGAETKALVKRWGGRSRTKRGVLSSLWAAVGFSLPAHRSADLAVKAVVVCVGCGVEVVMLACGGGRLHAQKEGGPGGTKKNCRRCAGTTGLSRMVVAEAFAVQLRLRQEGRVERWPWCVAAVLRLAVVVWLTW